MGFAANVGIKLVKVDTMLVEVSNEIICTA